MTSTATSSLIEIRVTSLRAEAVRAIRAAIIRGELRPGEIHSAVAIAARLGVSATPVREAMIELAQEGVVEPVRNRGFHVVPVSRTELDQMLDVRLLLEVPAAAQVAGRLDAADGERLAELVRLGEAAADRIDFPAFLDHDRAFHELLLERAGNPRLTAIALGLRDRARLDGAGRATDHGALVEQAGHHARIVAAVVAGDASGARDAMRTHLEYTRGLFAEEDS